MSETQEVCSNCGSTSFEWGNIHTTRERVRYGVGDQISPLFGRERKKIYARCCRQCGHLDFFVRDSLPYP